MNMSQTWGNGDTNQGIDPALTAKLDKGRPQTGALANPRNNESHLSDRRAAQMSSEPTLAEDLVAFGERHHEWYAG